MGAEHCRRCPRGRQLLTTHDYNLLNSHKKIYRVIVLLSWFYPCAFFRTRKMKQCRVTVFCLMYITKTCYYTRFRNVFSDSCLYADPTIWTLVCLSSAKEFLEPLSIKPNSLPLATSPRSCVTRMKAPAGPLSGYINIWPTLHNVILMFQYSVCQLEGRQIVDYMICVQNVICVSVKSWEATGDIS